MVQIEELKAHPKNPNKHSKEQIERLAEIIRYQGIRRPVRVSNLSGFITAGHGLVLACKHLGQTQIPVDFQDYQDSDSEYADIIADNSIASWADLDLASINLEVPNLGPDFNIDLLGIKDFEIEPADKYGDQDADAVPEIKTTDIKAGDLFQLGNHRLLCGDSTNGDDVHRLMNGEKADMVYTDPPYGVDYKGINNDSRDGLEDLLRACFSLFNKFVKPGSATYIFHSDRCGDIFHKVFREFCHFSSMLIWVKPALVLSQTDYQSQHEPCIYGWTLPGTHSFFGDRKQTSIMNFGKEAVDGHTTPKPVAMIERAIDNSSIMNELIYDPFLGSGSTLIACEKTNRRCFGMEIDPQYCQVIIDRWEKFTGQKAVKLDENIPDKELKTNVKSKPAKQMEKRKTPRSRPTKSNARGRRSA